MKVRHVIMSMVAAVALSVQALQAEPALKQGDVVAILGDSITEQKQYSTLIEEYLLLCQPIPNIQTIQFGWGGGTVGHMIDRLGNTLRFSPTVATTCFGANDSAYRPANEAAEKTYNENTQKLVKLLKDGGVRTIVIGSPTVADSDRFVIRKTPANAEQCNDAFRRFAEIDQKVVASEGVIYAGVHEVMFDVMAKSKAKYGNTYSIAEDGIHPNPNGHLIMAYAFLKALGLDGNIGTITYDAGSGKAEATEGHKVVSSKVGEVAIESVRYPFCFFNGSRDPKEVPAAETFTDLYYTNGNRQETFSFGTAGVLPFFPFNEDLNRYLLVVKNLKSPKAKITWGAESKEFTAEQLGKGINLAAEFLKNPFVEPFKKVDKAVRAKQAFETIYIKQYLDGEKVLFTALAERETAAKEISEKFKTLHAELTKDCRNAIKPVSHTIKIEEAR